MICFKGLFTLINIYYSLLLADNWMTPSPLVVCSYSDNVYRILMGCSGDKVINGKWLTNGNANNAWIFLIFCVLCL